MTQPVIFKIDYYYSGIFEVPVWAMTVTSRPITDAASIYDITKCITHGQLRPIHQNVVTKGV